MTIKKNKKISVIGQGYVGLPLSIELGKKFKKVVGYEKSLIRLAELKKKYDNTKEIIRNEFEKAKYLEFTNNDIKIKNSDFFIITVPTPIDKNNKPDLKSLKEATKLVGNNLKKNSIVIFESTVFPGCTEEVCVPILEMNSGLKYNKDFFCGYSPERINVGDKRFILTKVIKLISGSNSQTTQKVNSLYKSIIKAGTYVAKSIKVAEAAKIIENTQRDLNIALINELSIIFNKLKIDTMDVLDAAETKWNFIKYKPGLVGGHCIGVDPYYLTYKSKQIGYNPKIILSGRRLNDKMSNHIFQRVIKLMIKKNIKIKNSKVLILGCAFKKNCTDTRNSKVFDLAKNLKSSKMKVDIYDPWVNYEKLKKDFDFNFIKKVEEKYELLILAVGHDVFKNFTPKKVKRITRINSVVFDIKSFFNKEIVTDRL